MFDVFYAVRVLRNSDDELMSSHYFNDKDAKKRALEFVESNPFCREPGTHVVLWASCPDKGIENFGLRCLKSRFNPP